MHTDGIADLLTRIRNGQIAKHPSARVLKSKSNERFLKVLQSEGFIGAVEEVDSKKNPNFKEFKVGLKYFSNGAPVINTLKKISTPGRKVYVGVSDLNPVHNNLGISLVSTSKGIMSDREARKANIGGELLALIS